MRYFKKNDDVKSACWPEASSKISQSLGVGLEDRLVGLCYDEKARKGTKESDISGGLFWTFWGII